MSTRLDVFRVSNEKIDSRRFSGLVSRCVEWFDPDIERTNRDAPSPLFLQEILKTLRIMGQNQPIISNSFLFKLHSAPRLNFVGKDTLDHAVKISKLFDVAAIFMRCFQAIH